MGDTAVLVFGDRESLSVFGPLRRPDPEGRGLWLPCRMRGHVGEQ